VCGICGIIDFSGKPVERAAVSGMCRALEHRGPDGEGIYIDPSSSAGLGHRRLSIIDLSAEASQPMPNEDRSIWIVFNGEIYNFHELRPELEKKGHRFASHSDTETIVHLYEEYGEDCVNYLRGMFAFAIWDAGKKRIFAARDRVGKKPFLYSWDGRRFVFASEFRSMLESGAIRRDIEENAVNYYMSLGYIPAPMTIFKGVKKLMPAHTLTVDASGVRTRKYWDLDYISKSRIGEDEAAERFLELFREAVKIRLYSDVPLGAFLSGGVDSSCVVAMMSEFTRVKTFSIGFEEQDYSEIEYARQVSRIFGTEHREFIVKPDDLGIIGLLTQRYGEPYADSSCIPTYYVSRETKKFVTVALNGDGGDESFGGYERYQAMNAAEAIRRLGLRGVSRAVSGLFPDSTEPKSFSRRVKRFLSNAGLPAAERYLRWVGISGDVRLADLYSRGFAAKTDINAPLELLMPYFSAPGKMDLLDRLLKADVNTYLPNDLLVKVDIAAMTNSLEGRSPFLDHMLMEFASGLPSSYKIKGALKKYIVKKAFSGRLPGCILGRKKMGFGMPVGRWFRGELKAYLRDCLLSKASLGRGYFDPDKVRLMVDSHIEGRRDLSFQLWAMLMLELWHKKFIDERTVC